MGLLQWAIAGAIGYGIYRFTNRRPAELQHAGFAPGEISGENFAQIRNAGPQAMRTAQGKWDKTDEASDESFPASDPPATY